MSAISKIGALLGSLMSLAPGAPRALAGMAPAVPVMLAVVRHTSFAAEAGPNAGAAAGAAPAPADVSVRVLDGSGGVGEVLVSGHIDAPMVRVWEVLTNHAEYPRIFREVRRMSLVRRGIRGPVWRAEVTLPWPLGEQWSEDEVVLLRGKWTVNWYHVGGSIRENTGSWRLAPDGPGTTVTYRNRFDPGVALVPGWLVTWAVSQGIPRIVRDLRAHITGAGAGGR